MDRDNIIKSLLRKENKIHIYCDLMGMLEATNGKAANDPDFQRKFKYLYGMYRSHLSNTFYINYFNYMADNYTNKSITYEEIINKMSKESGRNEASFSSKLLATINPNRAVWDSNVRSILGIPNVDSIKDAITAYDNLEDIIKTHYMPSINEYRAIVDEAFKDKDWYNQIKITDMKIIDLILWCIGG